MRGARPGTVRRGSRTLSASNVWAGSARDYLNAPIDSWLAFYNVGYAASVTPEDGLDVTARIRTNVVSQSLVLTRTMDYWGRTGGVSIVLPYLYVESSSSSDRTAVRGVSDVGFLWQMNIFGGPALSREAFASFVPQTFASFHLFVGTPLGEYEPRRALNPSANRWTLRPTVNFSYTPDRGWTWLETYVSVAAFTPNNAFQAGGASRLTQRPLFIVEGHASRNITPRIWLSADAYYNVGGETSIDGMPSGQCRRHAATGRRHGRAALARRRHGAECRVRRRQARKRAERLGRQAHPPTVLVGVCRASPIRTAGRR